MNQQQVDTKALQASGYGLGDAETIAFHLACKRAEVDLKVRLAELRVRFGMEG